MSIAFYTLLFRGMLALAFTVGRINRKLRLGLKGRRGILERVQKQRAFLKSDPLWFHVASSGELEQCLPVLDEIKKRHREQSIFLSYFSPTAKSATELERERRNFVGLSCPWDFADYLPWDLPDQMDRFIGLLRPKAFIAIHREVWPNLLCAAKRRKLPCFLFAAYFPSTKKSQLRRLIPWLKMFSKIGAADVSSTLLLRETIKEVPIETLGDPRVERVCQRRMRQKKPIWRDFFLDTSCVFILASLWPADWRRVGAYLTRLKKEHPRLRILVAPHELRNTFIERLQADLAARRWTQFLKQPDFESALVVDKVGELAELYQVASLVFVGGSFKKRVHNVLEPAVYGLPILTGPKIQNSCEALSLKGLGALTTLESGEDLYREASQLIARPELRTERGNFALSFIESQRGAEKRYADVLLSTLVQS